MDINEALNMMKRDDASRQSSLEERREATRLIRCLVSMRGKAGLSQREMAERMGCSQSRISKIEHGLDFELTIGDMTAYAKATGFGSIISFSDGINNAAGMIKYHIKQANMLLGRIIELSEKDTCMLKGADNYSMGMLLSFCSLLYEETKKIPNSSFQSLLQRIVVSTPSEFAINCPDDLKESPCNALPTK